jgi:hypothetical protein
MIRTKKKDGIEGHTERMVRKREEKLEGKKPLCRCKHRLYDNIKMDVK